MKEIMKMIRFDFITVKQLSMPNFLGFIIICTILSVCGVFHAVLGVIVFTMFTSIFSPIQQVMQGDQRKIYGVLPVKREAVIKANFAENTGTMLIGEIAAIALTVIGDVSKVYTLLPDKAAEKIAEMKNGLLPAMPFKIRDLMILLCVFICIVYAVLWMLGELEEHKNDIRNMVAAVLVSAVLIVSVILLTMNHILPSPEKYLFPSTVAGEFIWAICLNLAAVAVTVICCRTTVKKLADKEL